MSRCRPLLVLATLALLYAAVGSERPAQALTSARALSCEPGALGQLRPIAWEIRTAQAPSGRGAGASPPSEAALAADRLLRTAEGFLREGRYRRALAALDVARSRAEDAGDEAKLAAILGSQGSARLGLGDRAQAKVLFRRSLDLAGASGEPAIEAVSWNNLGNLLAGERGAEEQALDAYARAESLAEASGQPGLAARASINAARLLVREDRADEARAEIDAALGSIDAAPEAPERAFELIAAGLTLADIADRADARAAADAQLLAHSLYNRAAAIAEDQGDQRTESYALGHLGELYLEAGRQDEALALSRQAAFLAQSAAAPEALYRWQWQAAQILRDQGQREEAITAYQGAIETLQSIRQDLPAFDPETGRSLFRETVGSVFLELADLLLQRAAEGGATPASGEARPGEPATLDLIQARTLVEQLKTAELEDYFRDDCVALLQSQVKELDQLEDRSAALYPIILEDRLELLVSLPDRLVRVAVDVPASTLNREAQDLREALVSFGDPLPSAQRLHGLLIEPIAGELKAAEITTLVFVPDGALRSIPLGALHDGNDFLIRDYAVATAPGLSLLDPRPLARTQIRPLLSGLSEEVQDFPALPWVDEELRRIQDLYGGTVLKNETFVETRVQEALENVPYTVVHIASHAQFAGDPEDSFLLTHNGQINMNELEQLIAPSRFRDEPVELIALSACETAAGDDRAALGLAGIAVKAGARSALATLWRVDDRAAAELAARFYENLGDQSLSKAEALRRAQASLQDEYWHPYFWAPFLIIGNWL